jgi:hypothetical protein
MCVVKFNHHTFPLYQEDFEKVAELGVGLNGKT